MNKRFVISWLMLLSGCSRPCDVTDFLDPSKVESKAESAIACEPDTTQLWPIDPMRGGLRISEKTYTKRQAQRIINSLPCCCWTIWSVEHN